MNLEELTKHKPLDLIQAQGWANYFMSQHDQLLQLAGQIIQFLVQELQKREG